MKENIVIIKKGTVTHDAAEDLLTYVKGNGEVTQFTDHGDNRAWCEFTQLAEESDIYTIGEDYNRLAYIKKKLNQVMVSIADIYTEIEKYENETYKD